MLWFGVMLTDKYRKETSVDITIIIKKKGTETVQWNEMDPRGRITSSWRDDEFLMRIQSNTIQGDPLRRFIAATIEPSDRIQPFPIKHP